MAIITAEKIAIPVQNTVLDVVMTVTAQTVSLDTSVLIARQHVHLVVKTNYVIKKRDIVLQAARKDILKMVFLAPLVLVDAPVV